MYYLVDHKKRRVQIRSEVFPMPDPWKGEEISPASRGRNGGSGDELWGPCAGVSGGSGDCCPDIDLKRGFRASGRGEQVLDYMLRLSDELRAITGARRAASPVFWAATFRSPGWTSG